MADAKDIPSGTFNLKFGSSFTDERKRNPPQFHTLRYDFKPNSVTNGADTFVAFSNNDDVHVAVPAEGEQLTVYKGAQKDAKSKECLLFFDMKTKTVRLEKVNSSINVKKTRDMDGMTEATLRNAISKLGTGSRKIEREPEQEPEAEKSSGSSSSSSDSDSDSDSSDNESDVNREKKTSESDSDDEKDLLAKMNTTETSIPPPVEDMPAFHGFSSRPSSSKNTEDLGLNLSESSDED